MRARSPIIISFIGALFLILSFVPHAAFADTIVGSDIPEDTTWTKAGSPYLVQGGMTIDGNATLSIEPGVVVQFDSGGWLDVPGRLLANGTSDEPVTFTSTTGSGWYGIDFGNQEAASSLAHVIIQHAETGISDYSSKDLSLSHVRIEDGNYGIEAYGSRLSLETFSAENMSGEALDISNGSHVTLKDLVLKNVHMSVQVYVDSTADISNLFIDGARGEALAVYVGSNVRVASSTIKNVSHSYGAVEAFVDSSLDLSGLTLEGVSGGEALSVFDHSHMVVHDSSVTNTDNYDAVAAFDSGSLALTNVHITGGSGDGVAIFGGGFLDMQDSIISGFTNGAGIADYGSRSDQPTNSISLARDEIKGNHIGVSLGSDNSTYVITNNSIRDNTTNGLESYGATAVDASGNFWGDPSGPYNDPDNLSGKGNAVYAAPGSAVTFAPWLSSWGTPPDPCAVPGACASNVLFLPGVEASRLYRPDYAGGTDKLWEPGGDADAHDLFMDASGESVRHDIYAKGVVDEAYGTLNIYKSFLADLDTWKNTDHLINDYRAVPYDWRVSLDDLLDYGREMPDGRLYYSGDLRATSTPYIIQELKRLAGTSKTGKVTIVAHSNGGLVAKALIKRLQDAHDPLLGNIDTVIMVAVPQVGTPQAVGAILHGYEQGLPKDWLSVFLTPATARAFVANLPSAYNLLPSAGYFTYVDDPAVEFDDSGFLAAFRARYGSKIHDGAQLKNFITDARRLASPPPSDLSYPSVGNAALYPRAEAFHAVADAWTPPSSIALHEVAGWGEDTLATIRYYEGRKTVCTAPSTSTCPYYITTPTLLYEPKEVVEGDGTVLVPSALWTSASTTRKYWVNLDKYNNKLPQSLSHLDSKHANILEIPELRNLIRNILTNATSTSYTFITTTQPVASISNERLRFILHSPLNLSATDNLGNIVSSATSTIPGGRWKRYGEVQVLTVPKGVPVTLALAGTASGSFTLDLQEIDGHDAVVASSTLSAVPSATSTRATMALADGTIGNASPLRVDYDGDGTADFSLQPKAGRTTVFDLTPPEAVIALDPLSQRLKVVGIDDLSGTTVSTTATSSTVTDEAGNTLKIIFKKFKREKGELKLEIQELRYNGTPAGVAPRNALQYEWSAGKAGNVSELEQEARTGLSKTEAHYSAKRNATRIEEEKKGRDNEKILPGLIVVGLKTEKGNIIIDY